MALVGAAVISVVQGIFDKPPEQHFFYEIGKANVLGDLIETLVRVMLGLVEQFMHFSAASGLGGSGGTSGVPAGELATEAMSVVPTIWDDLELEIGLMLELTRMCDTDGSDGRRLRMRELASMEELDRLVESKKSELAQAKAKVQAACFDFKRFLSKVAMWGKASHESLIRVRIEFAVLFLFCVCVCVCVCVFVRVLAIVSVISRASRHTTQTRLANRLLRHSVSSIMRTTRPKPTRRVPPGGPTPRSAFGAWRLRPSRPVPKRR